MRHLTHFLALFLIFVSVGSVGWAITIDYTPKIPLVGETVTLTAISDNNVTSYLWDFNDLNWIPTGNEPIYSDNTNDTNTSTTSSNLFVWVIPKQRVWIRSVRVCVYSRRSRSGYRGTFTIYGSDGTTVLYRKTFTFNTVYSSLLCWDFDVSDSNIILAPNEPIKISWSDNTDYTSTYYRRAPIESNNFIYRYYRDANGSNPYISGITINYSTPESDTLKVTSNTAGSYPITLNVTYDTGASESKTVNLNFYSPPYLEPETNTPYVDTDVNVYVRHDDRLTVATTWEVNDGNTIISTPEPDVGTFHFLGVGSKEINATTTLSDGTNTRDVNLSTTVDVQYITITPYLKYETTEEDWNTSAVDSTRLELWDTETGELIESVDNVTTHTFQLTRSHLYKLVVKVTYSTITFQRVRYIQGTGDVDFNVYLPDPKIALFYTIYLTDTSGLPLNGYKLVIERFISGVKAYIPISEAYPGPDGSTSHFLEPSVTYKVKVYAPDGSLAGQWDWTADPNVRTVTIRLPTTGTTGNIGTIHVEYTTPWQNLIITIPDNNEEVNAWPYTIEVGISDGSASLEQAQVSIYKAIFDVNVPRLDVNITDPAGGTVEFNAWSPGLYIIHIKIKKEGEWYDLPPRYVLLSGKSFLSGNFGLSDFGYILLATISSLSVAGFLSQFSPVGGAIGGLATMGFFTYLNPGATVVGVSMWHIFLLTAIMVLGVSLIRTWI